MKSFMQDAKEFMLEVCRDRKEFRSLKLSGCTTPNSDDQMRKFSDDDNLSFKNYKILTRTSSSGSIGSEGKIFTLSKEV